MVSEPEQAVERIIFGRYQISQNQSSGNTSRERFVARTYRQNVSPSAAMMNGSKIVTRRYVEEGEGGVFPDHLGFAPAKGVFSQAVFKGYQNGAVFTVV